MSLLKIVFVFGVLAVSLSNVLAISPEEEYSINENMFAYVIKCSEDLGFDTEDLKKVEKSQMYYILKPCVAACLFKREYLIDDKGLYDITQTEEFIKKYIADEEERKQAIDIIDNCKGVNELEVTDGEKGCERSKALLECFNPLIDMFAS